MINAILKSTLIQTFIIVLILLFLYFFNFKIKGKWRIYLFIPFFISSIFIYPFTFHVEEKKVVPYQSSSIHEENIEKEMILNNQNKIANYSSSDALLIIWISGMILSCIYHVITYSHFRRKNDWILIEKGKILCYQTAKEISPFSIGFFKLKIILPASFYKLTENEQRLIIEHEKKHFEFYHLHLLFLYNAIKCIYWFNPFVYLVLKPLKEQMEYCVDEEILQNETNEQKNLYCNCMMKYANQHSLNVNFSSQSSLLRKRINQIFKEDSMNKKIKFIMITFIMLLSSCGRVEIKKDNKIVYEEEPQKIIEDEGIDFDQVKKFIQQEASQYEVNIEKVNTESDCVHLKGTLKGNKSQYIKLYSLPHPPFYYYFVVYDHGERNAYYFPYDYEIFLELKEKLLEYGLTKVEFNINE